MASKSKRDFFERLYDTSGGETEIDEGRSPIDKVRPGESVKPSLSRQPNLDLKNKASQEEPTAFRKRTKKPDGTTVRIPALQRHNISDSALLQDRKQTPKAPESKSASFSSKRKGGKAAKEPRVLPESQRIFQGLRFFYFPKNEVKDPRNPRNIRVRLAIERGAVQVKEWGEGSDITHIIADEGITYQHVLKGLQIEALPDGIILATDLYPADCIRDGWVEPVRTRHRVDGFNYDPPCHEHMVSAKLPTASEQPSMSPNAAYSAQSSGVKRLKTRRSTGDMQISPPVPSNVGSATASKFQFNLIPKVVFDVRSAAKRTLERRGFLPDALDEALKEVQEVADLPLDGETDETDESPEEKFPGERSSDSEAENGPQEQTASKDRRLRQANFICMKKSDGKSNEGNPNASTIDILQKMASYYDRSQDQWRTNAYRKAINVLRQQPQLIATKEEARALSSIGERLAEKIEEIVQTKRLRRLDETASDPLETVRQSFMDIYGVGLKQASKWIASGWRSLEDLRQHAKLTLNQQIGLDHYDDFVQRIPRDEVKRHGNFMDGVVSEVSPHLKALVGGSYRRGASDSGDIDFLVTSPTLPADALSNLVFEELIARLFNRDYLKCHLTRSKEGAGNRWLGAACLPGTKLPWRRVDILVVPHSELGAALIYWTGNDIFNRSMRLLARKKGMRLNQRGLFKDVLRGRHGEKMTEGNLVEGQDEKKIFSNLGVPYRPPEHRNC